MPTDEPDVIVHMPRKAIAQCEVQMTKDGKEMRFISDGEKRLRELLEDDKLAAAILDKRFGERAELYYTERAVEHYRRQILTQATWR